MIDVGEKLRLEVAGRCEFLISNRQQLGTLGYLALQFCVSFPKMRGHLIKLVSENLDLIAGLHVKLMIQVSFADPLDAALKRLERSNDPLPHKQTRKKGHSEGPHEKSVHR